MKKVVGIILIVALCGIGIFMSVSYYLSLRTFSVEFSDVKKASLYKNGSLDSGDNKGPEIDNLLSGSQYKLPKGMYTIYYEGSDGYESKFVEINIRESNQVFKYLPNYTEEKLSSVPEREKEMIYTVLKKEYGDKVNEYKMQSGKFFKRADWFGSTLEHRSKTDPRRDTLRFVAHKVDGAWILVTKPPHIILSKFIYKDVPEEILREVNAFEVPALEEPPALTRIR